MPKRYLETEVFEDDVSKAAETLLKYQRAESDITTNITSVSVPSTIVLPYVPTTSLPISTLILASNPTQSIVNTASVTTNVHTDVSASDVNISIDFDASKSYALTVKHLFHTVILVYLGILIDTTSSISNRALSKLSESSKGSDIDKTQSLFRLWLICLNDTRKIITFAVNLHKSGLCFLNKASLEASNGNVKESANIASKMSAIADTMVYLYTKANYLASYLEYKHATINNVPGNTDSLYNSASAFAALELSKERFFSAVTLAKKTSISSGLCNDSSLI